MILYIHKQETQLYKKGGNIMLNIVVVNCDEKHVEYEWDSKESFIKDMGSDNEHLPMLDDVLAEVNTDDDTLYSWWRNTDSITVNDLVNELMKSQGGNKNE